MLEKSRKFFSPPVFEDAETNFVARNLNIILLSAIGGILITMIRFIALRKFANLNLGIVFTIGGVIALFSLTALRYKHVKPAAYLTISTFTAFPLLIMIVGNGIHDTIIMLLPVVIIIASMLLTWRGMMVYVVILALGFGAIVRAEVTGRLVTDFSVLTTNSDAIDALTILAVTALMSGLLTLMLRRNLRHLGETLKEREASEERYRLISNLSTDYVFSSIVHKDGRITHNWEAGAFESISGYTPEEFRAHGGWRTTVHPDDLIIDDQLLEKLKSNQKASGEMRIITKSGETRWIRDYVYPVWDEEENRLAGIYGAVQNIDEQKMYEEKLHQRADQQEALRVTLVDISSELEVSKLLQIVLERAVRLSNTNVGELAIFDEETSELVIAASHGLTTNHIGARMALGEGTMGQAISIRKAFIVDDYRKWEGRSRQYGEESFHSSLSMPLFFGDRLLGAIALGYMDERKFTSEDIQILTPYATHTAIAMQNAKLFEDANRQLREMSVLHTTALTCVNATSEDALITEIVNVIRKTLYPDSFGVLLWDDKAQGLRPHSSNNSPIDIQNKIYRLGEGISGTVAERRESWRVPDVRQTSVYVPLWQNTLSELCVPMMVGERLIGVINLESNKLNAFSGEDERILSIVAGQLATSIERLRSENEQRLAEEALRQSEERYRTLFDGMQDGVYRSTHDGKLTVVNPAMVKMFGYASKEEMLKIDIKSDLYFSSEDRKSLFLDTDKERIIVYPLRRKDGSEIWVEDHARYVRDGQGHVIYHEGLLRDVTERKQAEEALRASEEKFRELNVSLEKRVQERTNQLQAEKAKIEQIAREVATLRQLSDFLQSSETIEEAGEVISKHMDILFQATGGALYLADNQSADLSVAALWGYADLEPMTQSSECWGMRRGKVHYSRDGDASPFCAHFNNRPFESMCLPLLAQGETIGMISLYVKEHDGIARFTEEAQNLAIASADSISLALANLRLRERLRNQSIRDPLTGLFNRRFMEESLAREVQRASRSQRPLCVVMFEVDDFKQYNNTFGHEAGDYVLKKVADTMRSKLRRSDFPCRYGGDEFTFILPDTKLEDGANCAEEIRRAVEAMALTYNNQALGTVTVRMGVAAYPKHGDTGEIVLQVADAASYKARAIGKNCVVVAD